MKPKPSWALSVGDIARRIVLAAAVMALTGCVALSPHRTQFGVGGKACSASATSVDCSHNAWESIGQECDCDLFFVEFDDQGLLYPEPENSEERERFGDAWHQIELTLENLRKMAEQEKQKLMLVVYVHGWKHNASAEDSNVKQFREILQSISLMEKARPISAQSRKEEATSNPKSDQPRKVVGIYLGWRGAGVSVEPFKEASFYSRKMTAERVAEGSARYLLTRLRTFQETQNCNFDRTLCLLRLKEPSSQAEEAPPVRMVIIGHSLGGLIVFNAISGALIESLTTEGRGSLEGSGESPAFPRFGDVVVLLNPAFEATRYTPLYRVATRRSYPGYQSPLLVALSSTEDHANRVYFPWGRRLSTLFELEASDEEREANVNTIGFVDRYITHELRIVDEIADCPGHVSDDKVRSVTQMRSNLDAEAGAAREFFEPYTDPNSRIVKLTDQTPTQGWQRKFCDQMVLTHRPCPGGSTEITGSTETAGAHSEASDKAGSAAAGPIGATHSFAASTSPRAVWAAGCANAPIWNISVDGKIMSSHTDIESRYLVSFLRQLFSDALAPTFAAKPNTQSSSPSPSFVNP